MSSKNICNNNSSEMKAYRRQGIDFLLSVLGVFLLGLNYSQINNSYFVSVLIYILPLCAHLLNMKTKRIMIPKYNRIICNLLSILVGILFIVCILGISGVLVITTINEIKYIAIVSDYIIKTNFVLNIIVIHTVLITISVGEGVNYFSFVRPEEREELQKIAFSEKQRKSKSNIPTSRT